MIPIILYLFITLTFNLVFMKHFKPFFRISVLLLSAMFATNAAAYDFYVDGIGYNVVDWDAVEVVETYDGYYGDVVIPSTVTVEVSQYYESYEMTYTVEGIGERAFRDCPITSVTLPNTIEYISDYAFYGCGNLQEITIPDGVYFLGSYAFGYCTGLTSIALPNSVTDLGWETFYCCTGLTSVEFSSSLYGLPGTFFGCTGLTSVEIPASVEYLDETFRNCSNLTNVVIPSTLYDLGSKSFYGCDKLMTITCEAVNPPSVSDLESFPESVYNLAKLYVPAPSIPSYASANVWKQFVNILGIGEEVIVGDLDGDGRVSIADLSNLIDLLLANDNSNPYADVDGDGIMSVADVATLIDMLLN